MASNIQKAREIEVFVCEETTKGTFNLSGLTASAAIRIVGPPQFNQQPSFTESEEIVNSASRADRFLDRNPPGDWSLRHYARIGNLKSDAPEHDVLYKAALGAKSSTANYTLYSLAVAKPSLSFLFKEADMVFGIRGATINAMKSSLSNKGAVLFEHSGNFMELLFAGKVEYGTGMTYTSGTKKIVFPTSPGDDYKKFCAGMRIKIWDNDAGGTGAYLTDGSNAYFLITEVSSADNSITISQAISGGWTPATGDRIDPWYPTASLSTTRILEMRSGKVYRGTAGVNAISITGCDFSIANNIRYLEDEITDSGYPEDYSEGSRQVDASISLYLRTDDLKYYADGKDKITRALYIEGRDPSAPTVRTNAMQIAMPKVLGSVPNLSGDTERVLKIDCAALVNSAYEDELTMKFGDLTA